MPRSHNVKARRDASDPQLTFDLHAEVPPGRHRRHRPTISRNEKRRNEARLVFNKIIASHYSSNGNGYSSVGALFVTWEATDLRVNDEVKQLQTIFDKRLGFTTETFQIPSEKPDTALLSRVANFVHQYNDPDKLLVLYYAGHGFAGTEESDDEDQLSLAPRIMGDAEIGSPQTLFSDVVNLLRATTSDVLLIVDCCFASRSFSNRELGRRKFELLASSMDLSPSPGKPGSFTTALIDVTNELLEKKKYQRGFSTSILYRHLYHHSSLKQFKPLLFDQSQFDYGKIWLRPRLTSSTSAVTTNRSDVSLDLKVHLKLTPHDEIGLAMNELAKGLQYLPHVHRIDFEELHAGDDDVAMFLNVLGRATMVKKVIQRLKERVALRRQAEQMQQESEDPAVGLSRPASFYGVVNRTPPSSTQNWNFEFAQFSNGTRVPEKISWVFQRGRSAVSNHVYQRRRAFRIPHMISVSYMFDFTIFIYTMLGMMGLRRESKSDEQRDGSVGRIDDQDQYNLNDVKSLQKDQHGHEILPTNGNQARRRIFPRERFMWATFVIFLLYMKSG